MGGERRGSNLVFFFKQKTAYEMLRSLVGSEMCIRDSDGAGERCRARVVLSRHCCFSLNYRADQLVAPCRCCLLYTSDAADDLLCVDLGGRRIIKKKNLIRVYLA